MKIEQVTVTRADEKSGDVGHFSSAYDTYLQLTPNVEVGVTYTIHGYVRSASSGKVTCLNNSIATSTKWNEVAIQIKPTVKTFHLIFAPGEYWIYNWKLEKGTVITPWTASSEDLIDVKNTMITMGSSINQLKDSITSKVWMTEVNAAKGEVESHVSTVEQKANKIDWLVKSGTDASNMVMTDQSIAWISKNINLTGNATFSSFLDSSKTYISGDKVTTGSIKSKNYVKDTTGSLFNLNDGTFDSKNFKIDSSGNARFMGVIESNNSNTLFSIKMDDGNLYINGTKNNKSIEIGRIAGFKPIDEQTSNYDTMTITCKYGDAISFDIYDSSVNYYHPKYIINNGRNPDGLTQQHIWYGTECHNGAEYHNGTARFQNLLINTNTNNSTALYITQNSKALVFDACTLKDDGTYVDKGYSYTINNGQNPNGLTQQHIWYGTECHNGRITSKGGIDLIGNSLYLYATNGSTLPDNGKNYTGALWGTCGNQGIYMTILGADVGDMLSLSVKHSDNIYYGYIQFKEVGLTQPIMFYKPAYIGTLHLGSSAVVDSDRNLKKEISSLNIEEISKFIYSLNPVSYKYKKNDSDRLHHGLIAQEVKRSMENKDWGVYVDNSFNTSSSDCSLGLRYEELIPDLIATVQSQNNRIIELERQLLSLQNQVSSQGLAIQQQSLDNQLVI